MIVTKKQTCYTDLISRILTLDIAPGSMLDEKLLSDEYELSRTPLREVFQKLAGEGYLNLQENRGAKVSSMDLPNMRNFFQSAPMIYAAIARLAAENANERQITALKMAQKRFRMASENSETREMAMHNHEFHRIMGDMAGNPYLSPSLNRLLIDHTRMSQMFYKPVNSKERLLVWEACDQHDQMIEAIEKADPATIVELTMEHWELSRGRIEKFVRPDPLDMDLGMQEAGE
ncbi:MAG: GntR family transcriptional regulator [Pseudomonadota bacterium]